MGVHVKLLKQFTAIALILVAVMCTATILLMVPVFMLFGLEAFYLADMKIGGWSLVLVISWSFFPDFWRTMVDDIHGFWTWQFPATLNVKGFRLTIAR